MASEVTPYSPFQVDAKQPGIQKVPPSPTLAIPSTQVTAVEDVACIVQCFLVWRRSSRCLGGGDWHD